MSFSQQFVTPWKQNVTLPCQTVGIPSSRIIWSYEGKRIESKSNRLEVSIFFIISIQIYQLFAYTV